HDVVAVNSFCAQWGAGCARCARALLSAPGGQCRDSRTPFDARSDGTRGANARAHRGGYLIRSVAEVAKPVERLPGVPAPTAANHARALATSRAIAAVSVSRS